ncbi:MAG: phenylalanine--tRNA ligase subunit beta, partial [Spirochaetota bacterium]|nr:phenylalanine--tRNA ligase subunit beta [Spirochaetota bacterium]
MLVSHNLLKTYVKHDFSVEELSDRLTMQGLEVEEIVTYGESLNNVKIGIINSIERHPNADKLTICSVNIGNEDLIIVCGASNMNVGDKVCVALLGAKLPNGLNIKKTKIRGVESYGMLCSKSELNLENTSDGIWILSPDATIGSDINTILPEKDAILNIALTANRGDCLSLMGVAREIAGMTFQTANYPNINIKIASNTKKADISIIDKDLCFRYTSRIVKGVKVKESPEWLKNALVKLGSRPINNVVDITNFVLLELGHPLHAFDLNKLNGQKIIVRKAKDGEHIVGIDGVERKLTSNMLVIADEKMPVAIAGVMGGQYSCVTNETTDLLLESAYFLPESVRSTSKIIDLSTESSYRFERGTDINNIIRSLDRCASLIYDICGGEISELVDVYPNKITQTQVELRIPFV